MEVQEITDVYVLHAKRIRLRTSVAFLADSIFINLQKIITIKIRIKNQISNPKGAVIFMSNQKWRRIYFRQIDR